MTSKSTTTVKLLSPPSPVPWTPHAYQKRAMKFLVERGSAGLFLDPGLGKTSITLGAFKILKKRGLVDRMIVVAPLKPAQLTWPDEVRKWTDFGDLTLELLHGPKKEQRLWESDADILVLNYEGIEWFLNVVKKRLPNNKVKVDVDMKRLRKLNLDRCVVVWDELSNLKNTNTVRFKALKQMIHMFQRRWGLTGSPAANGMMDLFGECFMLDMGNALGKYITHYRLEYFTPGYDGFSWELQPGAEERIYDKLSPLVLRMAGEDYLELPEQIVVPHPFELPQFARELYDEMERELFLELDDGEVIASNTAVKMGKCRQIASGGIYLTPDVMELAKRVRKKTRDWTLIHNEKTELLAELVRELQGAPLLVAYEFEHDLVRLRKQFGDGLVVMEKGASQKEVKRIESAWNAGDLPLLAGHPASIAKGLNLQKSSQHVAWYTGTWNYEWYDQLNRRVARQGNPHARVFIHQFFAVDTVEELVFDAMTSKRGRQNALFEGLKARQRRRGALRTARRV